MGGRTGQTKQHIVLALYAAEQSGRHITVGDLATELRLGMSTISGHLTELRENAGYLAERANVRGWIKLTPAGRAFAQGLQPHGDTGDGGDHLQPLAAGIAFHGLIAAGPAIRIEQVDEQITLPQFDPARHFALRVRGTSMVGFGILNGDIAIFRKVATILDVPDGKIVAARVPEGTGIADDDQWLDQLDATVRQFDPDGASIPPLDHVTLKRFTARMRAYVQQGMAQERAAPVLRGSTSVFRPLALAEVRMHFDQDHIKLISQIVGKILFAFMLEAARAALHIWKNRADVASDASPHQRPRRRARPNARSEHPASEQSTDTRTA